MAESQQSVRIASDTNYVGAAAVASEPTEVVNQQSGWAAATCGNYVVTLITGRLDTRGARQLQELTATLCREHAKVGYLNLLAPTSSSMMERHVRRIIDETVRQHTDRYGAAAIVFEGQGFAATFVRSIVTAINLATKAQHPNRVFSDLEPALSWLQETFPRGTPTLQLRHCMRHLAERLAPR